MWEGEPMNVLLTVALVVLSLGTRPAMADCAAPSERTADLRYVRSMQTPADLALAIVEKNLRFTGAASLEGPCADSVQAFRMTRIAFGDGAVFDLNPMTERFDFAPLVTSMNVGGEPYADGHPAIDNATFIMAANVDGRHQARELDVGVWKTGDGYLVAAFIRQEDGYSAPIDLVRSTQPIRSVTFFPSPDANSGNLGLVEDTGHGIALVTLFWDHDALSRIIRPPRPAN